MHPALRNDPPLETPILTANNSWLEASTLTAQQTFWARWPVALLGAIASTAVLLMVVAYLISPQPVAPQKRTATTRLSFVDLPAQADTSQSNSDKSFTSEETSETTQTVQPEIMPLPEPVPEAINQPQPTTLSTFEPPPLSPTLSTSLSLPTQAPLQTAPPTPNPTSQGINTPLSAGTVQQEAVPLVRFDPTYPPRALSRGIEGKVTLEIVIDTDGSVKEAKVLESNPPRIFDRTALRAVRRWKFQPRRQQGEAVTQISQQTIEFRLER